MNKAELKEAVCKAIDARYADIEKVAMDIFAVASHHMSDNGIGSRYDQDEEDVFHFFNISQHDFFSFI